MEALNMVQSGFPVPPLHVRCAPLLEENAPELLALKESTPSWPVMLRISSLPHAPASAPCPSAQFRKRARLFENSIGLKGFSPCLRPFRAWALGVSESAGAWGRDAIRNITGTVAAVDSAEPPSGAFCTTSKGIAGSASAASKPIIRMDFSHEVPTGPLNVPPHIWQPVIIYLGGPSRR